MRTSAQQTFSLCFTFINIVLLKKKIQFNLLCFFTDDVFNAEKKIDFHNITSLLLKKCASKSSIPHECTSLLKINAYLDLFIKLTKKMNGVLRYICLYVINNYPYDMFPMSFNELNI